MNDDYGLGVSALSCEEFWELVKGQRVPLASVDKIRAECYRSHNFTLVL